MKEAVGFWLELTGEIVIIIVIILAGVHMAQKASSTKPAQTESTNYTVEIDEQDGSTKPAQAESTNYTVEIDEQDGSAVVYVENYEAITEDGDGLQIRKKGEE